MIDRDTQLKIREMKMDALIEILEGQDRANDFLSMPFDERLQFAINQLYEVKMQEKTDRLIKSASFKYSKASINAIDYLPERNLNKDILLNLNTCTFIEHNTDVAIFGATGSGKSYLACALGRSACLKCKKTYFIRMPDLLLNYDCIDVPIQKKRFISKYANFDLLIIDEWLGTELTEAHLSFLFELVEKRTETKSTIFCSQYHPSSWYEILGASSKTESIVNRILSGLCKVDMGTFNMRGYLSNDKIRI